VNLNDYNTDEVLKNALSAVYHNDKKTINVQFVNIMGQMAIMK